MSKESYVGLSSSTLTRLVEEPFFSLVPAKNAGTDTWQTASATAGATGPWTARLIPNFDVSMLLLNVHNGGVAATDTRALLDVGIGAAGFETPIISSLPAGFLPGLRYAANAYLIPINIPSNTQVSIRLTSVVAGKQSRVGVIAFGEQAGTFTSKLQSSSVDTYGANVASLRGTNLPTSNTYVEITSSTTRPYRLLAMYPCGGTGTVYDGETSTYTLAVGPSGSETVIGTRLVTSTVNEEISSAYGWLDHGLFYGPFPQGTRIACKQSIGRNYRDVIVLGIP